MNDIIVAFKNSNEHTGRILRLSLGMGPINPRFLVILYFIETRPAKCKTRGEPTKVSLLFSFKIL